MNPGVSAETASLSAEAFASRSCAGATPHPDEQQRGRPGRTASIAPAATEGSDGRVALPSLLSAAVNVTPVIRPKGHRAASSPPARTGRACSIASPHRTPLNARAGARAARRSTAPPHLRPSPVPIAAAAGDDPAEPVAGGPAHRQRAVATTVDARDGALPCSGARSARCFHGIMFTTYRLYWFTTGTFHHLEFPHSAAEPGHGNSPPGSQATGKPVYL